MWKRIAQVIVLTPVLVWFVACSSDDEGPDQLTCTGEQCNLECPVGSPDCQAACTKGADCDLDCNDATCDLDCGSKSDCTADCSEVGGCDARCEGQSSCAIDCTGAGGCDLGCAGGSSVRSTARRTVVGVHRKLRLSPELRGWLRRGLQRQRPLRSDLQDQLLRVLQGQHRLRAEVHGRRGDRVPGGRWQHDLRLRSGMPEQRRVQIRLDRDDERNDSVVASIETRAPALGRG